MLYSDVAREMLAQMRRSTGISRARAGLWPAAAHPCAALTLLYLVAGLMLLLPGTCARAAEPALETVVVTGSRQPQAIQDLAGSVSVLDGDSLGLTGHQHIQQSLARIPGANFARGDGQEYLPSLRSPVLSGAGACGSLLAAADGVSLRATGFCNVNELFEAHTEMAGRLEVVRGPAGTLYGSNALHGVINVISPELPETRAAALGLEAGPHDYVRTRLSASGDFGRQRLGAFLSLTHDGSFRDNAGLGQQKLTLRQDYQGDSLTISSILSAANLNQETAGYIVGEGAYKDRRLRRSNPNPEAFRDARSLRLSSHIEGSDARGGQFSLTPYLRYTRMEFLQHFLPGKPLEENGQRSLGLRSSYRVEVDDSLRLVAGLDTEYTRAFLLEIQDAPTEGSDFLRETIPTGRHYDYEVDAMMAAPFVQAEWSISEPLLLSAGLRYEVQRYDYRNRMPDGRSREDGSECGFGGCRFSRPADRMDQFGNWSPKLGLIYQLQEEQQLFLNLAHGFRAPQATELYRLQREQQVADLDPEEIASVELGLRGRESGFDYELVGYSMRKRNVIFRDADFFNRSGGKTAHRGLEIAMEAPLGNAWRAGVTANYGSHRYRRDLDGLDIQGNLLDSAPRAFGSARLKWEASPRTRAELEWLYQGSYYTDAENAHSYPGHRLFNLRAEWRATPDWTLLARVLNLTNRAYAERADYNSLSGSRYFPGAPRGFYLEARTGI